MIDELITCLLAMVCTFISHSCETRFYNKNSTTLIWWSLCSVRLSQVFFISSTGWRPTIVSDICFCSQIAKLLARLLWSMAYCHTTLISPRIYLYVWAYHGVNVFLFVGVNLILGKEMFTICNVFAPRFLSLHTKPLFE